MFGEVIYKKIPRREFSLSGQRRTGIKHNKIIITDYSSFLWIEPLTSFRSTKWLTIA